jgi:hypothetical protein
MREILVGEARAHCCGLDDAALLGVLAFDIELNALGIASLLDRPDA